jgi:hypothetical protein
VHGLSDLKLAFLGLTGYLAGFLLFSLMPSAGLIIPFGGVALGLTLILP